MDSKTIVAFVLMFLIWIYFFQPKRPPQNPVAVATNSVVLSDKKNLIDPRPLVSANPELEAKIFTLKNADMALEINGFGRVLSAKFLKYQTAQKTAEPKTVSFQQGYFNDSILLTTEGEARWKIKTAAANRLVLEAGKVIRIVRSIELPENGYFLKIRDEIYNDGLTTANSSLAFKLNAQSYTKETPKPAYKRIFEPAAEIHESLYWVDNTLKKIPNPKVENNFQVEGQIGYGGFSEKYFFYGVAFQNFSSVRLKYLSNGVETDLGQKFDTLEKSIPPKESTNYEYGFYFGPKAIPELERAAIEMREVVDYGSWLGPIARLLLSVLHFFNHLFGNYGVGIILLTILVKLALFPLAFKSAVSMRKLQLVQPKMKEIRDKFKDDKQRLQVEMMNLYKAEKVNPVGGCLPMLLQMPVFFALYRVFYQSIEFRHAPFFGWITDLSSYDHLYLTPVLLTIFMWYQTKVTPQPPAMDENEAAQVQRAMMKWMPVLFGAISVFLPSGLNIYLLVNVLISLIQQVYMNKHLAKNYPLAVSPLKANA